MDCIVAGLRALNMYDTFRTIDEWCTRWIGYLVMDIYRTWDMGYGTWVKNGARGGRICDTMWCEWVSDPCVEWIWSVSRAGEEGSACDSPPASLLHPSIRGWPTPTPTSSPRTGFDSQSRCASLSFTLPSSESLEPLHSHPFWSQWRPPPRNYESYYCAVLPVL